MRERQLVLADAVERLGVLVVRRHVREIGAGGATAAEIVMQVRGDAADVFAGQHDPGRIPFARAVAGILIPLELIPQCGDRRAVLLQRQPVPAVAERVAEVVEFGQHEVARAAQETIALGEDRHRAGRHRDAGGD